MSRHNGLPGYDEWKTREPNYDDFEDERESECDCCGERKAGCSYVWLPHVGDTMACLQCRGEPITLEDSLFLAGGRS